MLKNKFRLRFSLVFLCLNRKWTDPSTAQNLHRYNLRQCYQKPKRKRRQTTLKPNDINQKLLCSHNRTAKKVLLRLYIALFYIPVQ